IRDFHVTGVQTCALPILTTEPSTPAGPNLAEGVPLADLPEGAPFLGHVGDEPVLLVRRGNQVSAIGATCSHYGGPLAEGLVQGRSEERRVGKERRGRWGR